MSCFIVRPSTVAAIADFTACLLNHGFNFFGFETNGELSLALMDCKRGGWYSEQEIFKELARLNREAFKSRYANNLDVLETLEPLPEYKENTTYKARKYQDGRPVIEKWHYEMLKMLDCFLYQCSEDGTDKTHLYKGLVNLRNTMAMFIVRANADYDAFPWG